MQAKKSEIVKDGTEQVRRAVHDLAAAIISMRALAETLAEHVPTLVAISRAKHPPKQVHISPAVLDSLAAIPSEMIDLCAFAKKALNAFGDKSDRANNADITSRRDPGESINTQPDTLHEQVDCSGVRVLLVEDEETARYVFSQTLETHGCLVTVAANGEEALRLFDIMDFDLVLMDLRLPGLSGCDTTERLREIESKRCQYTRIVGLTASPLLEDQVRAKAAGMDEVLIKPIDDTALRTVFSQVA